MQASEDAHGLSSCRPWGLEHSLNSCGQCLDLVAPQHVGYSWIRDQTYFSCLAGGFFTTEPPGKPLSHLSISSKFCLHVPIWHRWIGSPDLGDRYGAEWDTDPAAKRSLLPRGENPATAETTANLCPSQFSPIFLARPSFLATVSVQPHPVPVK